MGSSGVVTNSCWCSRAREVDRANRASGVSARFSRSKLGWLQWMLHRHQGKTWNRLMGKFRVSG